MSNGREIYICYDPNGKQYKTKDLMSLCYAHHLEYSAMVNVANGYSKSHKGWLCLHYRDSFTRLQNK